MDGYEEALEKGDGKNYNSLQKFILFSAGARPSWIKDCPDADGQFFVIGGAVLLTTIAAWISGTYAFSMLFENRFAVGFLGVFWAVIIYNTDRSIIVNLAKSRQAKKAEKDNNSGIVLFVSFFARVFIAGLVAFIIGIPLEIYIFKKELNLELSKMELIEKDDARKEIFTKTGAESALKSVASDTSEIAKYKTELSSIDSEPYIQNLKNQSEDAQLVWKAKVSELSIPIEKKLAEIRIVEKQIKNAVAADKDKLQEKYNILKSEYQGYKGQIAPFRTIYNQKEKSYQEAYNARSKDIQESLDFFKNQLKKDEELYDRKRLQADSSQKKRDSLIEDSYGENLVSQIAALSSIKNDRRNGHYYSVISLGIKAIIIIIELLPLLFKLFSSKGSYEDKVMTEEYISSVDEKRKRLLKDKEFDTIMLNHKKIIGIRLQTEINKEDLLAKERQKVIDKTIEQVTQFQNKLISKYIKAWYQKENKKSDEVVNEYLKDSSKS